MKYKSIFVPEVEIDLPNYLTEILIKNFLGFTRKPIPTFPFWRKDVTDEYPDLEVLRDRYVNELTGVKQLLRVFEPNVLAEYFVKQNCVGFKRVKKETQSRMLYDIFQLQCKFHSRPAPKELPPFEPSPSTPSQSFTSQSSKINI